MNSSQLIQDVIDGVESPFVALDELPDNTIGLEFVKQIAISYMKQEQVTTKDGYRLINNELVKL